MKGLAIGATVILVLGVVLLFVVVPKMFQAGSIASAFDPLGYNKRLASLGAGDDLERAIKCAQARCFNDKGCEDLKKNDITWNRNAVSCYEEFCKKENLENLKLKESDKVCDDNSKNYPVEFQIIETGLTTAIQADDLKTFGCVVPAPSTCSSGGFINELVSGKTVLYIDQSLLVPGSVKSEGAGIFSRDCAGKLDLVKYGENVVTFVVPGGVVLKGIKIGTFTVLKAGLTPIKLKSAIVAGAGLGSVSEALFQQIEIIKSAELKPGENKKIYIWARDYSGIGGFFRGIGSNVAGAKRGTSDYVVLCGEQPANCKGTPKPCEERKDKDTCERPIENKISKSGCKWDNNVCKLSPSPKACKEFTNDDMCISQSGCCWKDQCESLEARLGVSKDDPEFEGFRRALDAVGGVENALILWGIESLDISKLYNLPAAFKDKDNKYKDNNKNNIEDWKEEIGFKSWQGFGLCKYKDSKGNEVKVIPGTCALDKVNSNQPAYCISDGGKQEFLNYPWKCDCPPGFGTGLGKGEFGGNDKCQQFDSNKIETVELGFYNDEKTHYDGKGKLYFIPSKQPRIITAALLDNDDIVITGIKKEDVEKGNAAFTIEPANFGTLGGTVCEESGSVNYFSCSTQIISDKAGKATVTFEYKPKSIKRSIEVEFTDTTPTLPLESFLE